MRVLVLGASGMLGNAVYRRLASSDGTQVWGTVRDRVPAASLPESPRAQLLRAVDVLDTDCLMRALQSAQPDVVVNCVGLIKQLAAADDPISTLPLNSILPHRIARLCGLMHARFIHISTDCVFSGRSGNYTESDTSDAEDLYGKSKYIGEVRDLPHAITLRTSIIGHELATQLALVEWFLAQTDRVKGYSRAVFSGMPTVELARVIQDFVMPRPQLWGLYHVAAEPITKLDLLRLIKQKYGRLNEICQDDSVVINRSLDGRRFSEATGYVAPPWDKMIDDMKRSGEWKVVQQ